VIDACRRECAFGGSVAWAVFDVLAVGDVTIHPGELRNGVTALDLYDLH
jgi:hypothetical protein